MRVTMTFDFSDEDRQRIVAYRREHMGTKGLAKLATRGLLRDWIGEAIDSHWINVEDVESHVQIRKDDEADR